VSDSNGRFQIPPAPDTSGAVNLAASILAARVMEIATATIKDPLPRAPALREEISISHKGDPAKTDVDFVRNYVDGKRWQIMAKLGVLGIDPSIGEFGLIEIGYGENRDGALVANLLLTWSIPEATEKQTPLHVVES
jgi:hypothetical protein